MRTIEDTDQPRGHGKLRWFTFLAAAGVAASCLAFATQRRGGRLPIHPIHRALAYSLNFTLSAPCSTSAGIFGSDGHLVRTLWGNQYLTAGPYSKGWDGTDDYGNAVALDTFTAKLLTHNVYPNWDGTIGNSSTYSTGTTKLTGLGGIIDVTSNGNNVYLLRNYNEVGEEH